MMLSSSDILRIRNLGFFEDFFIVKKNGNRQLKNLSERCVFHNGQRCTIYNYRSVLSPVFRYQLYDEHSAQA